MSLSKKINQAYKLFLEYENKYILTLEIVLRSGVLLFFCYNKELRHKNTIVKPIKDLQMLVLLEF